INIVSRGPNSVNNFFGIGNESHFADKGSREIGFYRNRYDLVNADIKLSHTYGSFKVNAGVAAQYYNSERVKNQPKFLNTYNAANPQENVFASRYYTGLVAGTDLDTRDNPNRPTKGIYWHTTIMGLQQLNNGNDRFGQIVSEFNFYLNPDKDSVFTISNRTGLGTTIGNAAYYQQLKLGGLHTLRGFHTWRFTGKTMAYNDLELRLKVLDFNSYLFPGSIGILGFNDVGRVWSPNESSSQWHDGYGFGIFLIPADLISVQFSRGYSKEGSISYLSIGYNF
ncbi:MAG: hypothetical protein JWP67_1973, partial [Mucilaginibacter sp.]|nr:hypothetical protein [Mucilaginibacter sp.]